MELRHLRYFVAVGEEQHYNRAAQRLRVAQPALSRQIQNLEEEIGFKLFDRLPSGVKLSVAGQCFMEDARRILEQVSQATVRAKRVASGQSGTLRVGFVESMSWHGVIPDSFREFRTQQPNAELQLRPLSSREQIEAVHSGALDAGFVFAISNINRELAQLPVASINLSGSEADAPFCPGLAEGQCVSAAHEICGRCAVAARRRKVRQTVIFAGWNRFP